MSKRSSSDKSRTDWSRVRAIKDRDIVSTPEQPEASTMHIVRGIVREGLKPVPAKVAISLRVDVDVLEWSRAQGPGYGKHRPGSPREGSGNCPTVQRSNVPDTKLPSKVKLGDATLVPSFLGHYWLTGKPAFQNSKWAILDYSAAANGPVVAYRWNGEAALSNAGFVEAVG